jgi:hypothetical protein
MNAADGQLLTFEQVASRLQKTMKAVYNITRRRCRRRLKTVGAGRYKRVRPMDLENWISANTN